MNEPLTDDETADEQQHLDMLYRRLDELRTRAAQRLAELLRETGGTPQARSQRDAMVGAAAEQVAQYDAVESGLCFGRLDFADDRRRYVGRIGIFDDAAEYEPVLLDWRAEAARPFYLATAASPLGVRRRRHIRTRERTVVALDDEVLDLTLAGGAGREDVTGEAALLSALTAGRTGRMRDIVATIQAEQDRVIRAELDGVLVVQGGPGTGKTAVALHRAAYLLYTYRQQLTRHGVLIVGPNETFLRYISQVLPSLAETGVLLRTIGDLFPGLSARRPEPPEVAEIKGRPVMADVLAAAVRDRQRVPTGPVEVAVEGHVLSLDPDTVRRARDRARRTGRPHNLARPAFAREIVHALSGQLAQRIGADPLGGDNLLDEADRAELRRELRREPEVLAVLDWLWPALTAQQVVAALYASQARLDAAAGALTAAERRLLRRAPTGGFSTADVPLLDEAAELLGADDAADRARAARQRQRDVAYAEGVLEITVGSRSIDLEDEADPELLTAADVVDARGFAERHADADRRTAAERAAADRTWAFGHVIVDEAQELSPMAWRMLMRRCPSRSMTLVGDVAQTGDLAGTSTWDAVLAPYVADRWRLAELTVNYRTPSEIMTVAADVLAAIGPELAAPRSVRAVGDRPEAERLATAELAPRLVDRVRREVAAVGDGRLGVIVPGARVDELGTAVAAAVPGTAVGQQPDLANRVVVLTVRQAKGLEFDTVLVVEPAQILAESARGTNDLYVALTRATRRLRVLHTGTLPAVLDGLAPAAG